MTQPLDDVLETTFCGWLPTQPGPHHPQRRRQGTDQCCDGSSAGNGRGRSNRFDEPRDGQAKGLCLGGPAAFDLFSTRPSGLDLCFKKLRRFEVVEPESFLGRLNDNCKWNQPDDFRAGNRYASLSRL
jgi:hypothetical protein